MQLIRNPFAFGFVIYIALLILLSPFLGETRCRDGWRSPSIGKQGACSWHGGVGAQEGSWIYWVSIAGGVLAGFGMAHVNERTHNREQAERKSAPSTEENSRLAAERQARRETARLQADFDRRKENKRVCPKCGARMRRQLARRGKHRGKAFWGCSLFPLCDGIVNID